MSFRSALSVYRMIGEYRFRGLHQLEQSLGAFAFGQIASGLLIGDVVRWGSCHFLFAVAPYHQVAIAHAWKKFHTCAAELAVEIADDLSGFLRRDVTRREVFHRRFTARAGERHEIAAKRDVVRSKRNTHARGFQWRAAGMIDGRIVTHDAHVTDVAAGWKTLGDHMSDAEHTASREPVHVRRARCFERSFAAENVQRIVGHAVALENDEFHGWSFNIENSQRLRTTLNTAAEFPGGGFSQRLSDHFTPQIGNQTGSTRI